MCVRQLLAALVGVLAALPALPAQAGFPHACPSPFYVGEVFTVGRRSEPGSDRYLFAYGTFSPTTSPSSGTYHSFGTPESGDSRWIGAGFLARCMIEYTPLGTVLYVVDYRTLGYSERFRDSGGGDGCGGGSGGGGGGQNEMSVPEERGLYATRDADGKLVPLSCGGGGGGGGGGRPLYFCQQWFYYVGGVLVYEWWECECVSGCNAT